ncbi:MAG TPA: GNAT family N-acetyltransferase [Acidobacteriaceae bacterium]|nr:GNAT family N-acetyltransferase [Acidobacteriaceae bacterium]
MSDLKFHPIEPFTAHHKKLRAAFSCGSSELDRYIKHQATQDIERRACVVYVLTSEDGRLAGFYTLTQDNIASENVPPELIKQLNLPRYEQIGATLLGRLARDLTYRGKGIGELLLADALKRALVMSRQIASAAVVVDAKDQKAHRFYKDFGFIPFPESEKRLFLPMATIEQLYPGI